MERSLASFGVLGRRLFVIIFAFAMVATAFVVLPSEVRADLPMRIAYFRDGNPWGTMSNENAMDAVGIPYDTYTSADFGSVVLSNYKKLVIGSAQPYSFYQAIVNDRARLENWLLIGGVFEMHMATYTSEDWAGLYMPGGFTCEMDLIADVGIVNPGHDIVTIPNPITDGELDGWFYSSHGLVRDIQSPYDVLLDDEASGDPVAVETFLGKGTVLATMQTLEWAYSAGYSSILENYIAYMPTRRDHDIAVTDVDLPAINERTQTVTVNATIKNLGLNDETGFMVNFFVNGVPAGASIVPSLESRNGTVVSFPWTPMVDGSYNITIRVPPIPLENFTTNNNRSKIVIVIDTTPPETPTGLSVDLVPSGSSLNISWDANTEPDLTLYDIYRSMDATTYVLVGQVPAGTEDFLDSPLDNGLTYFYRISAEDYVPNESPWSPAVANAPDFDSDGDGLGDMSDFDDDNDGVADDEDAFPRNPDEWIDTDGDGVGDNADNDDDNDGYIDDLENQLGSDSKDSNSIPVDTDGDGVPDVYDDNDDDDGYSDVVEEEAGSDPKDPNSTPVDTDGDGIIDQYDEDDDDDGYSDIIEEEAGSDPKDDMSTPSDNDGDGIVDQYDEDDDNDGYSDDIEEQAGSDPMSAISQPKDTDGDGSIDLYDPDDDDDGVYDDQDAFPTNSAESVDTDGDSLGNQLDEDDDGDGVSDSQDAFPLNPFEYIDTDNDGIGDNSDVDSDGNGIADYLEPVAPDAPEEPFDYTPILLIIVIVMMIVILIAMMRSNKEESGTAETSSPPPPEE